MNPQVYCYEKVLIPGSIFYFAIKRLPQNQRDKVIAVQAFYQEIETTIFQFTDMSVIEARLNWWREQIFKIMQQTPDHPVALFLQQQKVEVEMLLAIIDGLEQNLYHQSFKNFADVITYLQSSTGLRETLLGCADESAKLIIAWSHYIQNLHRYVQKEMLWFPDEELDQFKVKLNDFFAYKTTPEIRALLRFQIEKMNRLQCDVSGFHLSRVKYANAVMQEIANSDFMVLESFIDLTPLRKWWVA